MLVKNANLTFRQIVRSANREGGEHDRTHNLMLQAKKQRTGLRITLYALRLQVITMPETSVQQCAPLQVG